MLTNKDIRVENGNIVINGDKYPLDGQSPETIMEIVEDNSDSTPTEDSTAPITSGGVYTADKAITDTIGDITQTGITGSDVAAQLSQLNDEIAAIVDDSTNYCEIGNTLIQWGQIGVSTTASTTSSQSVTFPKSYANPNFLAVLINPMTGDDIRARASGYTTTGFTANVTDNSSTTRYLSWVAVGKKAD